MKSIQSQHEGFSLIELMVVIAIVGIIAMIALPSYNSSVEKSRRADGQAALVDLASKMEAYFYSEKTYTTDLAALGYTPPPQSPEGFYALSVLAPSVSCPITSCYVLQAAANDIQSNDGDLTLSSTGLKLPADKW